MRSQNKFGHEGVAVVEGSMSKVDSVASLTSLADISVMALEEEKKRAAATQAALEQEASDRELAVDLQRQESGETISISATVSPVSPTVSPGRGTRRTRVSGVVPGKVQHTKVSVRLRGADRKINAIKHSAS